MKRFLRPGLLLCFMVFSAWIAAAVFSVAPERHGDGFEYIYTAQAFVNHFTPAVSGADVRDAQDWLVRKNPAVRIKPDVSHGFVRSRSGTLISRHFWGYSACVAPFQAMLAGLSFNELNAFRLFNTIVFLTTVLVAFLSIRPDGNCMPDAAFAFLICVSPALPYLRWTGPEVLSASLMTLSLLAMNRGFLPLSAGFASLAAMQNPPCAILSAVCVVRSFRSRNLRGRIVTALGALPVVAVPFFNLVSFGCLNPIEHAGGASFSFVSLHRFVGFWFDLNQGMVVWSATVAFLFFVLIVRGIVRREFCEFDIAAAAVLAVFLSCTTVNWNAGSSTLMRYGTWIYPMAAYFITRRMTRFAPTAMMALLCVVQAIAVGGVSGNGKYLRHNALADFVLRKWPAVYVPEREIFRERTSHKNGAKKGPFVFADGNTAMKMLVRREERPELEREWVFVDKDFKEEVFKRIDLHDTGTGIYVNCPRGAVIRRNATREGVP